jgi:hypothetical protein
LVEVLKTESDLAAIGDEEVRECFANILAAKRLVRNAHELPKNLVEELRVALNPGGKLAQEGSCHGDEFPGIRRSRFT